MNPTQLAFALTLLDLVPLLIRGVSGAVVAFQEGRAKMDELVAENRDPTPEEWDALDQNIARLRDDLHTD